MAEIQVELNSLKSLYGHAEPLDLQVDVANSTSSYIYIVRDRYVRSIDSSGVLHLIFGEKISDFPDTYHCFEAPERLRLDAGQRHSLALRVQMPSLTTQIDADGVASYVGVPFEGIVEIQVDWGYSNVDFQSTSSDPRGDFLSWQKLESSTPVSIEISPPSP